MTLQHETLKFAANHFDSERSLRHQIQNQNMYLNLEVLIPDWFECVVFGCTAFGFILRLTHIQHYKRVCFADKIGILDVLSFNQLHMQYANWVKLQKAAASANSDTSISSGSK